MPKSKDGPVKEVKRMGSYLLTEEAVEAVHREARTRRCWPNRVVEELIQSNLLKKSKSSKLSSTA